MKEADESSPKSVQLPWESIRPDDALQAIEADLAESGAGEETRPPSGGVWTIPLLCMGIALIACCVLIPQADSNRRLAYEQEKLKRDVEHLRTQTKVNEEFLARLQGDPSLAERLAQRQMKMVRAGSSVLELDVGRDYMSPFSLVSVPPPEPLPAYRPMGGRLSEWCRHPKTQLYLTGGGLLLMACGLVLGYVPKPPEAPAV